MMLLKVYKFNQQFSTQLHKFNPRNFSLIIPSKPVYFKKHKTYGRVTEVVDMIETSAPKKSHYLASFFLTTSAFSLTYKILLSMSQFSTYAMSVSSASIFPLTFLLLVVTYRYNRKLLSRAMYHHHVQKIFMKQSGKYVVVQTSKNKVFQIKIDNIKGFQIKQKLNDALTFTYDDERFLIDGSQFPKRIYNLELLKSMLIGMGCDFSMNRSIRSYLPKIFTYNVAEHREVYMKEYQKKLKIDFPKRDLFSLNRLYNLKRLGSVKRQKEVFQDGCKLLENQNTNFKSYKEIIPTDKHAQKQKIQRGKGEKNQIKKQEQLREGRLKKLRRPRKNICDKFN